MSCRLNKIGNDRAALNCLRDGDGDSEQRGVPAKSSSS